MSLRTRLLSFVVAAALVVVAAPSATAQEPPQPQVAAGSRFQVEPAAGVAASVWVADPALAGGKATLRVIEDSGRPVDAASPVLRLSVTDRTGAEVADLPSAVAPGAEAGTLTLTLLEPAVELVFPQDALAAEADPSSLVVRRRSADGTWTDVPSAWVAARGALVAHPQEPGDFVAVPRATEGVGVPVVALDLDDDAAVAMWDGELVGELALASRVAALVETYVESVCVADVVVTRTADAAVVAPELRAAAVDTLTPALALTLGFDATDGLTSGGPETGGARVWSDDAALAAALDEQIGEHTARHTTTAPAAELAAAPYPALSTGGWPYARIELGRLDHSFDRAIAEHRPDLYALAVAKAVVARLTALPAGCGEGSLAEATGGSAAPDLMSDSAVSADASPDGARTGASVRIGHGFSAGVPRLPLAPDGTWADGLQTRILEFLPESNPLIVVTGYTVWEFPADEGAGGVLGIRADFAYNRPFTADERAAFYRTESDTGSATSARWNVSAGGQTFALWPGLDLTPRVTDGPPWRSLGYYSSSVRLEMPADWDGNLHIAELLWTAPWAEPADDGGGPSGPVLPGAPSEDLLAILAGYGWADYFLYGGDPVNLSTGAMVHTEELFEVTGVGDQVIDIEVTYNGGDGRITPVGTGWSFGYAAWAQKYANGAVLVTLADGQGLYFAKDGDGYTPPAGARSRLTATEDGVRLTLADGTTDTFRIAPTTGFGTLTGITDPQGNTYVLEYGPAASAAGDAPSFAPLRAITDQAGQKVTVESTTQGRITAFVHPDGRRWELAYDGHRLTGITDGAGRTRSFGYDASGLLVSLTRADGVVDVTNVYDDAARVVGQTDGRGLERTFAYDGEGTTTLTDALGGATVVEHDDDGLAVRETDPEGGVTRTVYDDDRNPVTSVDPLGNEHRSTFDDQGRVLTYTDPLGHVTRYTYDATGVLTSTTTTAPDGSEALTRFVLNGDGRAIETHHPDGTITYATYDGHGDVTSTTDAEGNVTSYGLDARGNVVLVTDALGQETRSEYDLANRLVRQTDPRGATTTYAYDAADNVLTRTDALDGVTRYTYDLNDVLLTETDPLGRTTTYEHNANLQVTATVRPDGSRVENEYDAEHHKVAQHNPDGTTVRFEYDGLGREIARVDEAGERWTTEYDAVGNVLATIDPEGNRTETTYDALGAALTVTDAEGGTTTRTYLPGGLVGTETDARGGTTTYRYDVMGRLLRVTGPDGAEEKLVRDGNGDVVLAIDARGGATRYGYDALRHEVLRTDAAGGRWVTEYDAVGNVVATVDPRGARTETEYDPLARPTVVRDALGGTLTTEYDAGGHAVAQTDPLGRRTSMQLDLLGRVTGVTAPDGGVTARTYDAMGRVRTETAPDGAVTTFEYDEVGRLTARVDAAGGRWVAEYDAAGRAVATSDPAGHRTETEYDGVGRPATVTDVLGHERSTTYLPTGLVETQTDELGGVTRHTYDASGREMSVTTPDGATVTYRYDENGNAVATVDQRGAETTREFDSLDREVLRVDALGGRWVTEYDAVGNVIATVDALGHRSETTFDALSRAVRTVDALGGVRTTELDAASQVLSTTDALGRVTAFAYDAMGRVTSQTAPDGATTTRTYDAAGRLATETDARGFVTRHEYDVLGREVLRVDAAGGRWATEYDALGNVVAQVDPRGARTATEYDALSRPVAVTDAEGGRTQTAYDARGVAVAQTDALGRTTTVDADAMGRPVVATAPDGGTTTVAYDEAGNEVSVTNPRGFTTTTEFDALNRPTAVVDALEGRSTTEYDAVGNVLATVDAAGARTEATYDALGRPVSTTDALGGVATVTYDAEGQVVATTDELGRTTGYSYDAAGRVVTLTRPDRSTVVSRYDATGNLVGQVNGRGHTVAFEVDALGRPVLMVDEAGERWLTEYDAVGNVVATVDPAGARSTTAFDLVSRPVSATDAAGATSSTTYDAAGDVIAETDALGHTTTYAYDVAGHVTSVTTPEGAVTTHAYDLGGNRTSATDALGNETTSEYDGLDREVLRIAPDGGRTAVVYDAMGRATSVTDPAGAVTSSSYDALGRLTAGTDGEGFTTRYAYDAVGNVLSQTSPRGGVTGREYDAMDRVVTETNAEDEVTRFAYDAQGNLTSRTDPVGVVTRHAYDPRDLLVTTVENAVDDADPSADTNVTTTVAYDARGIPVAVTDPRGGTTAYGLDAVGRVVAETDPLGRSTAVAYDPNGRVASTTAADGTVTATAYTPDGHIASVTYPDAAVTYAYDAVGNRTSMTDPLGTTTWAVDWAGRITSTTDARGASTSYRYDLVGNLRRTAYPDGRAIVRAYDKRGLAVSQTDRTGTTRFAHDADGALVSTVRPSGVSTTVTRDLVGRVIAIVHAGRGVEPARLPSGAVNPSSMAPGNAYGHCRPGGNGHPNQQPAGCDTGTLAFRYQLDERGLVTSREVRTDETTTRTEYVHDALGRLVRSQTGRYVAMYGWDAASNLIAETVSDDLSTNLAGDGHAVRREVDAANQLVRTVTNPYQLPPVQTLTVTATYDPRGNRVNQVTERTTGGTTHLLNTVTYAYDGADRLVGVHDTGDNPNNAKDDVVTTWSRDGIGRALSVTEAGVTRTRVYDGVEQVVVDGSTRVTRGPTGQVLTEAFEQVEGTGRNARTVTVVRDVLADRLGSAATFAVGGLIDADLALYGDFGQLLTEPAALTVTGFTGRTTAGPVVEFAARSYDPASRVWVQDDLYPGTASRSASLNRYAYVEGAPETYADSLGLLPAMGAARYQRLSAAEAAFLMAVAAQFLATPCSGDRCPRTDVDRDHLFNNMAAALYVDDTVDGWDSFDAGSVARARAAQDTSAQLERFFLTAWQAASVQETDAWAMLASLAVGVGAGAACGLVSAGALAVTCFLGVGALSGATYGGVDYAMTVDREDWDAGDFWTTVGINAAIGAATTGVFMAAGTGIRAAVTAIRSGSSAAARPTLNQILAREANSLDDVANTAGQADELAPPTVRYNRQEHYGGAQTNGPVGQALREGAEGTPCAGCQQPQVSGTATAPVPEHSPSLLEHYYGGGYSMTDAERRLYAQSAEAFDGTLCLTCQRSQGGTLSQLSREIAERLGLS